VRQGRAFGIHVLLGSQTLGGAYTLARATMGQMVVRIALQCNEADAYLIMDETNPAPRLLSRPGEGIYNDMAGAFEGNSPFQAAWLSDADRDQHLAQLRAKADRAPAPRPVPMVFEGNAPAAVHENTQLWHVIRSAPATAPAAPRVWLGAPNSIKEATEVIFERQAGRNLLVVGQSEEAETGLAGLALVALAAQFPAGSVRFILLDGSLPDSPARQFLDQLIQAVPHPVERTARSALGPTLADLALRVSDQTESESAGPATFLVIAGLQAFKQLRPEDEFSLSVDSTAPNAAGSLSTIVTEGPSRGCHAIITVDTYSNVTRFLGRRGLGEFHTRILFQMSPGDSAGLIDSPEASKLGLFRALLHDEREGYTEKFRPYALIGTDWPAEVARAFRSRGR
jgi:hypothetical protein